MAYANGQGTPVEPAPAPAPTVLEPAGPAPAVEAPAPVRKAGWGGFYLGGHLGYGWSAENDDEVFNFDTDLDGAYDDTVFTSATPPANAFSPDKQACLDAGTNAPVVPTKQAPPPRNQPATNLQPAKTRCSMPATRIHRKPNAPSSHLEIKNRSYM